MIIQLDSQSDDGLDDDCVAIDDICHTLGAVEVFMPMPKKFGKPARPLPKRRQPTARLRLWKTSSCRRISSCPS